MRGRRRLQLVALLCSFVIAACQAASSEAPGVKERSSDSPQPAGDAFAPPAVIVSLPLASEVAWVNLETETATRFADLTPTVVRSPDGTAVQGDSVAVIGSDGAGIALLSSRTGAVQREQRLGPRRELAPDALEDPPYSGYELEFGPDGYLYASADVWDKGRVYQLHPERLSVEQVFPVRTGQSGMAFDRSGRLWVLSIEGTPASGRGIDVIDTRTGDIQRIDIEGSPRFIAPGPGGSMLVSIIGEDRVLKFDLSGRLIGEVGALPPEPWGLDMVDARRGLVVSERSSQGRGIVSVVDFVDLATLAQVPVPSACGLSREVAVVGDRALVTCLYHPGVSILDLDAMAFVGTIELAAGLPRYLDIDEPRGLSAIPS